MFSRRIHFAGFLRVVEKKIEKAAENKTRNWTCYRKQYLKWKVVRKVRKQEQRRNEKIRRFKRKHYITTHFNLKVMLHLVLFEIKLESLAIKIPKDTQKYCSFVRAIFFLKYRSLWFRYHSIFGFVSSETNDFVFAK